MKDAVMVFTRKTIPELFAAGGTGDWVADRARVEKCEYVICTRNSEGGPPWPTNASGGVAHGAAFLVGRGLTVTAPDAELRVVIGFREYAEINQPQCWPGNRNPVAYGGAEPMLKGLDLDSLDWKPFPVDLVAPPEAKPLTIAQAKAGLAVGLGVPETAVEITIRA